MTTDHTKALQSFQRLLEIVSKLRDPETGCPWDKEQTLQSLKPLLIEEVYEVVDAVDQGPSKVSEELGDLMMVCSLACQIGEDTKSFTYDEVFTKISEKLITRHPHIFSDVKAKDSAQVLKNWEKIKEQEMIAKGKEKSILDGVPKSMPALLRAQRVGEKCARVGFEWRTTEDVRDHALEEVQEYLAELKIGDSHSAEQAEEFGDVLFSLVQLARRLKYNAEGLLNSAIDKYVKRFQTLEGFVRTENPTKGLSDLTLEEMDVLWERVKAKERAEKKL